jgi:hypothetical protein
VIVYFLAGAIVTAVLIAITGAVIAPWRGYDARVGFFLCLFTGIFGLGLMILMRGSLETPDEIRTRQQWEAYYEWQQYNAPHGPFG